VIYVLPVLGAGTPFLLLASTRISDRIQAARADRARKAWIDERIRTERHPARRAAWRMIRNDNLGDL
jgi:hypothetical protein